MDFSLETNIPPFSTADIMTLLGTIVVILVLCFAAALFYLWITGESKKNAQSLPVLPVFGSRPRGDSEAAECYLNHAEEPHYSSDSLRVPRGPLTVEEIEVIMRSPGRRLGN